MRGELGWSGALQPALGESGSDNMGEDRGMLVLPGRRKEMAAATCCSAGLKAGHTSASSSASRTRETGMILAVLFS